MSWSRCKIEIGKTGDADAMATQLQSLGYINDKSTSLSVEEGDTLTALASGGIKIAEEKGEPTFSLTTRVKEMTDEMYTLLTGATASSNELIVKSLLVADNYSVKLTPKNIGATGIKIRKTTVSIVPGFSEEEGHYVDITFTALACADGEVYRRFKVASSDWTSAPHANKDE